MATHSSVLAWRIPGTREPGGLPSVGSQSLTRLKRLSSSSSSTLLLLPIAMYALLFPFNRTEKKIINLENAHWELFY